MYGAGNIGRGFIGQIFFQSGYELVFIDVAEQLIEALNREGRYPVRILSDDKSGVNSRDIWIEGVRAINGRNIKEAAAAIAEADIMATAVGVRVLPLIAPVIAEGLKQRFSGFGRQNGGASREIKPLNIIVCENLIDANKELESLIKKYLSHEEKTLFDGNVGLVEASIGRMVPLQTVQMQNGNPLRVCVEAYGFLPVDKAAFRGDIPQLTGLCPFDNFDFYIQRKLFVHNLGHAVCAYLGMIRGDKYIYEAAGHGGILFITQNAMLESAAALQAKYGASLQDLHNHIRDLLRRFSNRALADTCARVGGDTTRKLGNKDRLVGALLFCGKEDCGRSFISAGTAAALYCHLEENGTPQSPEAARIVLREVSGLKGDSALTETILSFYSLFASFPRGGNFDDLAGKIINAASVAGQRKDII